jgi:branched-chain amino acid transport system permease protein
MTDAVKPGLLGALAPAAEASPLSASRPVRHLLIAALLLLIALPPLFTYALGEPYLIALVSRMVILGLAAVSLDLILGYGGLISFGHAAFFGVGGYAVAILAFHARHGDKFLGLIPGSSDMLVTLPAAVIAAALVAALIGALKIYGGDDGMSMRGRNTLAGFSCADATTYYYLCLVLFLLFLFLCRRIVASRFGMVLRGCKDNERRVRSLGYPTYGYRLVAFTIAGAGAGLAGGLLVNLDRFASPDMLQWQKSGNLMVMVILGGIGSLFGPALGAVLVISLETVLSRWTDHWMFYLGPILIAFVLFARRGLWGVIVDVADRKA